jgi:eukaryotic-like serine/threonine-protein kinase
MTEAPFISTERFRIIRKLGEGGMGVVYEAEDRDRARRVALKTFKVGDGESLYRFKREFRSLADLSHPNLVQLYDLVSTDAGTFFTMELVRGTSLMHHCVGVEVAEDADTFPAPAVEYDTTQPAPAMLANDPARRSELGERPRHWGGSRFNVEYLRRALEQLAHGLETIHRAGKLHRDIKPSNILVTPEGRLVILDFGLVRELRDGQQSVVEGIVGTPAYMSPEQAAGESNLTPASDWYSVGVLLYEVLAGELPFSGSPLRILMEKQYPTRPLGAAALASAPPDLANLSLRLLEVDPSRRPRASEVLALLGVIAPPSIPVVETGTIPFEGRERELSVLRDRFEGLERGEHRVVLVRGESGMGKSALVQEFLRRLRRQEENEVVLLEGRCYEREEIPYKAIDSIVDRLSAYWRTLKAEEAAALLPRNAAYLPRLFPVLGRVPAVAGAPLLPEILDPQERRTRSFTAFRELLQRLAERKRLILFVDDIQWIDADSVVLLADVFHPPDPPCVLLLLAARPSEGDGKGELGHDDLIGKLVRGLGAAVDRLELGPLSSQDSIRLVERYRLPSSVVARVAEEAAGSPFFLGELARYLELQDNAAFETLGLDDVLGRRVATLRDAAREILDVIVLAGEPIQEHAVGRAAGLDADVVVRETQSLRAASFVRSAAGRSPDMLMPYHDRIREVLARSMDVDRRRVLHGRLALALAEEGGSHEQLARHWAGAAEAERAADHARAAADEAADKLDFDRAASLYKMAIDLGTHAPPRRHALRVALGNALADAGRPADAAAAFSDAIQDADAAQRLELRRRVADSLLRGGYVERGLEALQLLLAEFGMRPARSPLLALLSLMLCRALLRLRGMRWTPRDPARIAPIELTRIDVCWGAGIGLSWVDTIRGFEFVSRHVLLALRLGDPMRVTRAFAYEASVLATQGASRRARVLAARAEEMARASEDGYGVALALTALGTVLYFADNAWRPALATLNEANKVFRTKLAAWECDTTRLCACFSMLYLGELGELGRSVPSYIQEAQRRGDRYAEINLRTRLAVVLLLEDDPARAARDVEEAITSWFPIERAFVVQHFYALFSACEIDLYRGAPDDAEARMATQLGSLRRSFLLNVPIAAVEILHLRGRIKLALAEKRPAGAARRALIREVAALTRQLARIKLPLAQRLAPLLGAGAAHLAGNARESMRLLEEALAALKASETLLYTAAARRRLGELRGGEDGRQLVQQADAWMATQDVKNPARITAMLAPGWGRPG